MSVHPRTAISQKPICFNFQRTIYIHITTPTQGTDGERMYLFGLWTTAKVFCKGAEVTYVSMLNHPW